MQKTTLSAIRGCLLGGAIGDALGYPIEFDSLTAIRRRYGAAGLDRLLVDSRSGKALVSDDTQMTLFTANGLVFAITRGHMRGILGPIYTYVHLAYRDWYATQTGEEAQERVSWLLDVPALHARRAPGNTCLQALGSGCCGSVNVPLNRSKGCGGIMRAAPVGLYRHTARGDFTADLTPAIQLGADTAAITHGHPLGWLPAAALVQIVARAAFGGCPYGDGLYGIVQECRETMGRLYSHVPETAVLDRLLAQAVELSRGTREDADCIRTLGEGWVAEETLAIAVFCALRHRDDFSAAVLAAVNHGGDSDSTGAVCGNITGAWLGDGAIDPEWLAHLELAEVIDEMARDLDRPCPINEYHYDADPDWLRKYCECKWKAENER